ncbi:hypothetical protein CHS0354_008837 [Potamilus streckersoni]|uniref:Uncharacterized protein n=1 Tax=Potamilus streckersoni TaxID=2493646 RepID=A0AAE0SPP8_9BIVA|nr:hypothetical protein CHS0354_008837 [Potamilus streckersoni]
MMLSLYFLLILFTGHVSSLTSFSLPPVKEYSYRGITSVELFSLTNPPSYRRRRSEDCTPDNLGVRFTADQQPVELLLHRNYDINVNAPLFVNKNGTVTQEMLNDSENVAVYHDKETGCAIMVECISSTRKFKLFGSFFNDSEELIIEPEILDGEEEISSARRDDHQRRETNSNDFKHDILMFSISNHIIYKRKAFRSNLSDFIQEATMRPIYQVNSGHSARVKRAVTAYQVELLMVADYSVYKFWLDKSSTGAKAKELLRQFYAFVLNGIDLRYKSVTGSGFSITILFAGLYIAETQSDALWTEKRMVTSGYPYHVNASAALDDFSTWIQNITNLPEYDHAMLFTAYDLVADNGNSTIAGTVYVNSTCHAFSQSVVEDHFDAKIITIAAHLLGHSLGSDHDGTLDGKGDSCSPTLSYIMAASAALSDAGSFDVHVSTNLWKFSSCSISYFQAYISRLNRTNCLTTLSLRYNSTVLFPYDQQNPGQIYSADTQCQYTQGIDSYFCRNIYHGNYTNMCAAFYCKISESTACYRSIAAERTTCGDKKWCVAGECITAAEAPSVNDACPFGNQPGVIVDGKQCNQLVSNSSFNCYNNTGSCCESCQNAYTGIIGCEYGDKTSGCIANDCAQYDSSILALCCETCNVPMTTAKPTINTTVPTTITSTASTTLTTTTEKSVTKKIVVTVHLSFNVTSSDDFSDRNTSSRYADMVRDALIDFYTRNVAEGIQIIILGIRRGSLIVEYATIFNSAQETFAALAKAMVVLAAGGNIILDGQVTSVLYMAIDNYTVPCGGSSKDYLCAVYTVISGVCPDNYSCVVFNDSPACQPNENATCTNQSTLGSMCMPCAAGSYQFRLGQRLEGESSCSPCAEGYYNSKAGEELCRRCEIGSFQNYTGQSSCFPCQKEYTTEHKGEQSEEACFREHCPEYTYAINISTYTVSVIIPPTRIGQRGYSWNRCKNDSSKAVASAFCQNITRTDVKWTQEEILEYCIPEQPEQAERESQISSQLHNISKIDVNEKNLIKILQETNTLIQFQELTSTDIGYLADILGKVSAVDNISKEMANEVLETFNTLLHSNSSTIQSAQESSGAANRILKIMEDIANKVEGGTTENPVTIIKPKIALSVWKQVGDSPIGIQVLHANENFIQNNSLIRLPQQPQDRELVDDAIYFQSDLLKATKNKLGMTVILNDVLFRAGSERYKVVSKIMAAKLFQNGVSITHLGKHYVRAVFLPSEEDSGVVCGYWNYKLNQNGGGWESDGCNHTIDQKIHVCTCNHLTNFALLLDLEAKSIPPEHEQTLEFITYVGLILSIIGLSLSILTFLCFRNLRRGRGQQTLFCLCISMLCYSIIFLVGIKRTEYYVPCIAVSVLIHYFILAAFMWMLMEGVLQYLRFVKVLGTYIPNFLMKILIPAWGVPLVPVIALLAFDYNLYYGGLGFCWMKLEALYYAFVIPICLIILVNVIIFIIVILRICRRPKRIICNQSDWKRSVLNIKAALSIFVLLGLTWIFGVVALGGAKLIFQYIFVSLNAFQGFFIFLLFTARDKQARDQWLRLFSRKPNEHFTSCGNIHGGQDTLLTTVSGRNQSSSVTDSRQHLDNTSKIQEVN